jgi:hypothetical protein
VHAQPSAVENLVLSTKTSVKASQRYNTRISTTDAYTRRNIPFDIKDCLKCQCKEIPLVILAAAPKLFEYGSYEVLVNSLEINSSPHLPVVFANPFQWSEDISAPLFERAESTRKFSFFPYERASMGVGGQLPLS